MSEITLRRRTLLAGAGAATALSTVEASLANAAPGVEPGREADHLPELPRRQLSPVVVLKGRD